MKTYKVVTPTTRVSRFPQNDGKHYFWLEVAVRIELRDSNSDMLWIGRLIREGYPVKFCCEVAMADSESWEVADIFAKYVTDEVQAEVDKGKLKKIPIPANKSFNDEFANWELDENLFGYIADRVASRMELLEGDKIKQMALCYHDLA